MAKNLFSLDHAAISGRGACHRTCPACASAGAANRIAAALLATDTPVGS